MSVNVENLSVAYRSRPGDVTAVDNVSFSLADGEIMGLAGESGSGKSTLGNALVYLDARMKATGGKVTVDGKELPIADNHAMRHRRMTEVSLVPQYAMSALTPTRKIGKLINDLLKSHHVKDRQRGPDRAEAPPRADRPQGGRARASTPSSCPAACGSG